MSHWTNTLARILNMQDLRALARAVEAELDSRAGFAEVVAAYEDDGQEGEIVRGPGE